MEAKDLRIGNLVMYYGFWSEVNGIEKESGQVSLECEESFECTELNKIESIPLTEEWLLKLDKINEKLMIDNLGIVIFKNGYAHQFVKKDYPYLHQLQNIYYALTQNELNIK